MKIYISGPMSGLPEHNFPAFHAAAARLRAKVPWCIVVNPAELNPDPGMPWAWYLKRDLTALLGCEAVALLPGWQDSKGACLERHVAEQLGMPIYRLSDVLQQDMRLTTTDGKE